MNKLALAAAALLPLVSGCVSSTCDVPTVTIDWALQDANGVRWDCSTAGVAYVDVYFDGTSWSGRYDCSAGGALIDASGFAPGVYPVTVEGIGADQSTIYDRAQFSVTVQACTGSAYYPVLAEGTLEVDYHFAPVDACHGGSMWFALYDEVAGQDISIIDMSSTDYWKSYYGCYSTGGGTALRFPVPYGAYTLRGIQEVVNPLTSPVSVYEMCTPSGFSIGAPGLTLFTPPVLQQTLPGAPPCF